MAKYDAKTLEREFKSAASLRISRKNRGNQDYANDAGANHNLSEDCQTIAQGFSKIDDLKNVESELNQCTSEQEFNSNRSRFIRQAEELENSLQTKTGSASSMFGICIIWEEYNNFLESKLRPLRSRIEKLKKDLGSQQYKHIEELKALKLEQRQIEARMKENKQKAASEKDPAKKALLLQLIEEDGEKLKENLEKQKKIPTVNLRFEPDKYVSDLIKSMKEAIKNSGGDDNSGGSGSGRNKNKKDDDDDGGDNGSGNSGGGSGSGSGSGRKEDNKQTPQPSQQQLIIFETPSPRELTENERKRIEAMNNPDTENQTNKQQEQLQMLLIIGIVGIGYYFFFFLPNERSDAKKEIEEVFKENSPVVHDDLDNDL
ncbi:23628_t:CDS:2 [Gigaspora margarita]|uniref:23628_t:CDS:1 n=1 Tax=Gigaspora margarita TaxID=4874 RepID=A0ABN7VUM8_GIGMA|nr:23628_t:CDS:2 [Gigaspora margarita]